MNKEWVGIRWNNIRHIWISASRSPSTKIARRVMIKTQICTKQTHSRFTETKRAADMFHPGSWQLWSKITRQTTCQPPHNFTQRTLRDSGRLVREKNTLVSHLIGVIKDKNSTTPQVNIAVVSMYWEEIGRSWILSKYKQCRLKLLLKKWYSLVSLLYYITI